MKVVWAKQASESLQLIASYICDNFGFGAKQKFLSEITDMLSSLEFNPYIGKIDPYMEGFPIEYRCVYIHRLSKAVYYVENDNIVIVALTDARRDPEEFANSIRKDNA
jgi:plasmid stabilization system protein ParE